MFGLKKSVKLGSFVVIVTVVILVLAFYRPTSLAGDTRYEPVLTGSMEPAIPVGSIIVIKETDPNSLIVGDVICYQFSEHALITHRIISVSGAGFITKGDANEEPDDRLVEKEDVIGKVEIILPYFGYLASSVRTPIGFMILLFIPATLLIAFEIRNIIKELRKSEGNNRQEKQQKNKSTRFNINLKFFKNLNNILSKTKYRVLIGLSIFIVGLIIYVYSSMVIIGHEQILSSPHIELEDFWRYEGALMWWRNAYVYLLLPLSAVLGVVGVLIPTIPLLLKELKAKTKHIFT
jgi:signal peptidase